MKTKMIGMAMLCLMVIFLSSCQKKKGCTDPDSINYDEEAEVDNESCQYEADLTLWISESTATDLVDADITTLTYHLDGELIGSASTSTYFDNEPNCNTNGAVNAVIDLGYEKQKTYTLTVSDEEGNEVESEITIKANQCNVYEFQ